MHCVGKNTTIVTACWPAGRSSVFSFGRKTIQYSAYLGCPAKKHLSWLVDNLIDTASRTACQRRTQQLRAILAGKLVTHMQDENCTHKACKQTTTNSNAMPQIAQLIQRD